MNLMILDEGFEAAAVSFTLADASAVTRKLSRLHRMQGPHHESFMYYDSDTGRHRGLGTNAQSSTDPAPWNLLPPSSDRRNIL